MREYFEDILTVRLTPDRKGIDIIDQTCLPGKIERKCLYTREDIWEAIKKLRVRGAPAIGVTAAYGLACCANAVETEDVQVFMKDLADIKAYLATARPTAVNLFWALNRMMEKAEAVKEKSVPEIKAELYREAVAIREEDVEISRRIGEIGYDIIRGLKKEDSPIGIMTHCNAGTLATAKYGTATAPMYMALEKGMDPGEMRVYCDETRPLLQGARLTALELSESGIPTTLQCDNMASAQMASGRIQVIFVGCDRVAANGDTANKIGTSGVAILAKYYGIPFYICAPSSTIDSAAASGRDIPIEMRNPDEVTEMWYKERMAPEKVDVFNPAFDVTDHTLITGIITEKGLVTGPHYKEEFKKLGL